MTYDRRYTPHQDDYNAAVEVLAALDKHLLALPASQRNACLHVKAAFSHRDTVDQETILSCHDAIFALRQLPDTTQ